MDELIKVSFVFTTASPSEPALPVPPCASQHKLSATAAKVYEAMGPGTPMLTIQLILQRSQLSLDDLISGLEELQHESRIVLIHRKGDIYHQLAFRIA
jgi:hypothetical protein